MLVEPELADDKFAELEGCFSPLAPMLQAFAERHNLRIEKYRHLSPRWDFVFRPGADEIGCIMVLREDRDGVSVFGVRELRDVERFRRAIRSWRGSIIFRDDPRLEGALKSLLVEIVTSSRDELKFDGEDYSQLLRGPN